MHEARRCDPLAEGEKGLHLGGRGAFRVATQPRLEWDSDPRPKHQGKQELPGELAVADPGLPLAVGL